MTQRLYVDLSTLLANVGDLAVYVVGIVIFWGILCAGVMAMMKLMDR